jgi:hypothetical protein
MRSIIVIGTRTSVALMLTLTLCACATTKVISHWQDPNFSGEQLKKIAIFIAIKDETERRATEDRAVSNLTGATKGVASYTLFPDQKQISKENEEAIKTRLTQEGIDGALVVRLQSVEKNTVYVPPQTAVSNPYGSFYGYSGYAYSYTYATPGYTYEEARYIIETEVYKLPEGSMIWSTTTETVSPNSREQLAGEVRQVLREDMIRDGVIAN